jgi:RNA-binding protein
MLTRNFLKTLVTKAHTLNPVVIIGNNGLTDNVHHEVDAALTAHELIKVRVNAPTREARDEMIAAIVEQHGAHRVQTIGHVVVLYRPEED